MSPPGKIGVLQPGIAIVKRDAAVERQLDLHLGSREAVAARLRMNLQSPTVPLHHVVVADDAFVGEAADAVEMFGSRAPSRFRLPGPEREAAIVVGDEAAQHGVGRIDVAGLRQAQLTGEAILQHAPETFDAALGLRRLRRDEGNAELIESATKLGGLALAGELFVQRPVVVVASEDAAAVAVEGHRDPEATQETLEQVEIALGGFREEELSGQDFAGGVVLQAQSSEPRAAALEPVVGRAVELNQFSEVRRTEATLAMSGRAAFSGRADPGGPQEAAKGLAAEGKTFLFDEFVVQMMIVETAIFRAGQVQDGLANAIGQSAMAGPPAADV